MNHSLTAVPGLLAGHWTHDSGTTGTTVVLFPEGAVAGVAVPGHASGGRELGALDPTHVAGQVHGICLSGGSSYGLAAADGVMAVLRERGIGFATPAGVVPIVPAAILYDLPVARVQPDAASGRAAAEAAGNAPLSDGPIGAGAGARVAIATGTAHRGGFGGWAGALGPHCVAAGVAVNAFGSVRDPESGAWLAGGPVAGDLRGTWRGSTTLAVVATDLPLDRAQCTVVARMASAALARTLYPAFTPFDGDTVFVASTGRGNPPDASGVATLGDLAAAVLARAIARAVLPSGA